MNKKTNIHHQESFQDISFEVNTNKKQTKGNNEYVLSSSMGKKQQIFPSTQRKPLSYCIANGLLMDQATTPMKYDISRNKQATFNGNQQVSQKSKYKQILKKLNETQQKLIESQKKYGQLYRKYEVAGGAITKVSEELRERKQEVEIKESQIKRLRGQMREVKEVQGRSYERVIATLRREVEELRLQLERKDHEISLILSPSNTNIPTQQSPTFQLLQQQLSRVHRQKLDVIASYELKLSELSQRHQQQFRQMEMKLGRKLEQEMTKGRQGRIRLEEMELELRRDRVKRYDEMEMLKEENAVLMNELQQLRQINSQLQVQLANTVVVKSQHTITPRAYQLQQQHCLQQLSCQLQCIKQEIVSLKGQVQHKSQLLQIVTDEKNRLFQQVKNLQQTLKRQSFQQIQHRRQFKSQIDSLLLRVSLLEQQKQVIQRQLLAERLQTFKLKQELQEMTSTLKKQYQLSLENLNKQLSMKINQNNQLKTIENNKEKQFMYIQLKQLEKKYELLTTEMLTVDDMMAIATKVHKRHSRFVKK